MADQFTYADKSISDIKTDQMYVRLGTASQSSSGVELDAHSEVEFIYTFDGGVIDTSNIKFAYLMSRNTLNSRYDYNIEVKLDITYYDVDNEGEEPVYYESNEETINIVVNRNKYQEAILDINKNNIKEIRLLLKNHTNDSCQFTFIYMYNTITLGIDEEQLEEKMQEITEEYYNDNFDNSSTEYFNNNFDDYANDYMDNNFQERFDAAYDEKQHPDVGTYIEARTSDPSGAELYAGRIWLREDLV